MWHVYGVFMYPRTSTCSEKGKGRVPQRLNVWWAQFQLLQLFVTTNSGFDFYTKNFKKRHFRKTSLKFKLAVNTEMLHIKRFYILPFTVGSENSAYPWPNMLLSAQKIEIILFFRQKNICSNACANSGHEIQIFHIAQFNYQAYCFIHMWKRLKRNIKVAQTRC